MYFLDDYLTPPFCSPFAPFLLLTYAGVNFVGRPNAPIFDEGGKKGAASSFANLQLGNLALQINDDATVSDALKGRI